MLDLADAASVEPGIGICYSCVSFSRKAAAIIQGDGVGGEVDEFHFSLVFMIFTLSFILAMLLLKWEQQLCFLIRVQR